MSTTTIENRPVPEPTPDSADYWRHLNEGELRFPACSSCGLVRFPPTKLCVCGSDRVQWRLSPGRGVVESFTVVHRPSSPAFADLVPYAVAIVSLDEGPRLMANIVECAVDDLQIGMPVEVRFVRIETQTLPLFAPVRG